LHSDNAARGLVPIRIIASRESISFWEVAEV
jgi:hypothetical protein